VIAARLAFDESSRHSRDPPSGLAARAAGTGGDNMTVSKIVSVKGRDVVTSQPHRTLQETAAVLAEKGIGAVVVTDAAGAIKGILSERDIVKAVAVGGPAALGDPVSRHMTAKVVTCVEADLIVEVMERMTRGRFRHMPVEQNGTLAGIVSIGDIVKHRLAETEAESQALRDYIQMAS
jgi:CBS domain-containing protein